MSADDFAGACDDAREALRRVVSQLEPGTGMVLHRAYRELGRLIEEETAAGQRLDEMTRDAPPPPPFEDEAEADRHRIKCERRKRWGDRARSEREALILQALGGERLTPRAIAERIAALLDVQLDDTHVRALLREMAGRGDLQAVRVPTGRGSQTRWEYACDSRPLDGPIADLERALTDDDGEPQP